jgi:uncharacterized protein
LTPIAAIEKGEDAMRAGHRSDGSRDRRCIVTGAVRDDGHLIRFVVSPDGEIVPDIAAKLPGRGIWVSADRATLERAIAKNHFAKAVKANVKVSPDLPALLEKQLAQRMLNDLGLARRSGALVLGFDNVARALENSAQPPVLIEAADGAADGKRKIYAVAHARGAKPAVIDCLTKAELSLALGKENVIHAALKAGALAERLIFEAVRLSGFRTVKTDVGQEKHLGPTHEGIA